MSQLLQLRSKIAVRPARATMTKTENNDGNMPAQGSWQHMLWGALLPFHSDLGPRPEVLWCRFPVH